MNEITNLLEVVVAPLLSALDATGLFRTIEFGPFYRLIAALSAVILGAYAFSVLLRPVASRVVLMSRVRLVGRVVALALAVILMYSILRNTSFVLGRAAPGSEVLRSNLGFVLVLGLMVFLEIRLFKKKF